MDKNNTPKLQEAMRAYLKGSYETAFNMFCELAWGNNSRAMYFLGMFFDNPNLLFGKIEGVNVVKLSREVSGAWYKLGASRGDPLATLVYVRNEIIEKRTSIHKFNDCFEAVKTMAIEGDAFAQMEMYYTYRDASHYENKYANYLKKDNKEEFKWLREAADSGSPEGMVKLGTCYDGGYYAYGVVSDYKEAIRWYQKAAELNNSRAMYNLGILYSNGRGVQQDHSEAFKWYMKSAELGDVEAMLKLGAAYENDLGVVKSYGEAFKWYMKASGTGHGRGVEGLAKVERLLVNHLNATPQIFNLLGFLKNMK